MQGGMGCVEWERMWDVREKGARWGEKFKVKGKGGNNRRGES